MGSTPLGTTRGGRARRAVARLLLGAVDLAAVAAVAAWCLGRLFSDRHLWSQWLLWTPTVAAIGIALVGTAAAARPDAPRRAERRRRRVATWTAVLVGLTAYLVLAEHRLLRRPATGSGGLTIVHWNMTATKRTPVADRAAALLSRDADITLMSNPPVLLGDAAWRRWTADKTYRTSQPFAIVTRLPLLELRPLVASGDIHVALVVVDASERIGRPLVIWLVDMPSDLRVVRLDVAERTRRMLAADDVPAADLIIGDFNMTRGSAAMRHLAPGYRDAFELGGAGWGGTYPRRWPLQHIDHVLVHPGLDVAGYRIIDPTVGEHRLQLVELRPERGVGADTDG